MDALFAPLVAFARSELIDKLDPHGRTPSTPIHVARADAPRPEASRPNLTITVAPRAVAGELRVASWWRDGGGTQDVYCFDVVRGDAGVEVVVRPFRNIISTASPRQPRARWP